MIVAHYDDEDILHITWHKNAENNYSVTVGDGSLREAIQMLMEHILSGELGINPLDTFKAIDRARAQRGGMR